MLLAFFRSFLILYVGGKFVAVVYEISVFIFVNGTRIGVAVEIQVQFSARSHNVIRRQFVAFDLRSVTGSSPVTLGFVGPLLSPSAFPPQAYQALLLSYHLFFVFGGRKPDKLLKAS